MSRYSLIELARHLDAELVGDGDCQVESIATLMSARPGQISFLANPKYRAQLDESQASAVIMRPKDAEGFSGNALLLADPYLGYAKLAQLMDTTPAAATDIAPSAVIDPSVHLGERVAIGHNAVIEAGADIGDDCQIGGRLFCRPSRAAWQGHAVVGQCHRLPRGSDRRGLYRAQRRGDWL